MKLYLLLELLGNEASVVNYQLTLMREGQIIRRQRENGVNVTANLFKLWDKLMKNNKTVKQTLKAASYLMSHDYS